MNIENYLFDTKWNKLINPLEKYLLELAKKNPLYTNLCVNLPWVSILWVHETILISEKFWFIKWLVDNDKINVKDREINYQYDCVELLEIELYEFIIMLLSIQEKPIEFLISILK